MAAPKVGPMSRTLSARTVKYYVCAGCWSALVVKPDPDDPQLDRVVCLHCETPGYVSKRYTEKAASESIAQSIEARYNLRDAVPFLNPNAGKQVNELLAELGF